MRSNSTARVIVARRILAIGLAATVASALLAAGGAPQKRAKPPQWDKSVRGIFFDDARQKLVGPRPDYGQAAQTVATPAESGDEPPRAGTSFAWSKLIAAEVLEDQIKSLQSAVNATVQTPSPFKGGGYKDARRQFTELAVLFGIVHEFDGEVRWQQQAAGIRDAMARSGFNCKVGTDASFKEARARKDDLENLVRGNPIAAAAGEPQAKWDKVAGRPPLMQRLEQCRDQTLLPLTANSADFGKNRHKLAHEAQIVAALAEVIQRDGFEFADDEGYLSQARAMRDGAVAVAEAARQKNYDAARTGVAILAKSCDECHAGYRSN